MTLFTAVLGVSVSGIEPWNTPWGYCGVFDLGDAAALAQSPAIRDPDTTHLLVLAPTRAAERAAILASTVAAVRSDVAICVEKRALSTAAFVRAVETSSRLPPDPNQVTATILSVLDSLVLGAWLPGVAKLESPPPTVAQHVLSWLSKGEGFLAVHGRPGWVDKLPIDTLDPKHRLARHSSVAGAFSEYDAHAYGELPEEAIKVLFAMGLSTRPKSRPALGDARAIWGTDKAVEFVITPPSAGQLGPRQGYCLVCGDPVWSRYCPFCRSAASPTPLRPPMPRSVPT